MTMTAETLKPFIPSSSSVENYLTTDTREAATRCRRRSSICYFLAIIASVLTFTLLAALLSTAIWNTVRISKLQTEVRRLNRVIDSMQQHLGLTHLNDLDDLDKEGENNNALIDDVIPNGGDHHDDDDDDDEESGENEDDADDDDDDDDNDDDDVYEDFEEYRNKFRHYQETEDDTEETDSIGDDNLYDDFEKYADSKKKNQSERKTRSVVALNGENENFEEKSNAERQTILRSFKDSHLKSIVGSENYERRRSPLRIHSSRKRKFPLLKSAKSIDPVTSNPIEVKAAVHFHLSHKVPYHAHTFKITNHRGDVYVGKPSFSKELEVDNYFHVENGVLTVRESGLYYVYAQICYNNNFPQNGFIIFHGDKEFLQCLNNVHTNNESMINTCHTSGLIALRQNEHIHIRDFHSNRRAFLDDRSNRSYFGLIKI